MATGHNLRRLLKKAPNDVWALIDLLRDGLDWPFPEMEASVLQPDDVLIDWNPEELHLDPEKVANVADIFQVPKFTQSQECGVFVLNFTGGRLPVGAVRRVVERLVANRRGRTGAGRLPQWSDVNDLIFFCLGSGPEQVVHIVNFREQDGKTRLRVLSWSNQSTATQLDLIAERDIGALKWNDDRGPSIVGQGLDAPGFGSYRGTIRGARALAAHMAAVAQRLRDELLEMHEIELADGPIRSLYNEFRRELIGDLTPGKFADVFAQTMVYGLLSARIAHPEKFDATAALHIDFDNPLINALYGKFSDDTSTGIDLSALGLQDLAADLASADLDVEKMLSDFGASNRREDPVVHFYEEFLNQYDHAQRIDAGAFYTPTPVVEFMVESVDHLLRDKFGLELGIADTSTWGDVAKANGFAVPRVISPKQRFVSMIDPATGTGTYLVEWIRRAKKSFLSHRPASEWADHYKNVVMPSMHAFEIMLAPYAVAHLKVALESSESAGIDPEISILLTDSLEQPPEQLIFGPTDDPIAAEGERAAELKLHERFTVCIGNPPYDREQRKQGGEGAGHRKGGVVRYGTEGVSPLLGDVLQVMRDTDLGKHAKNLYNDYVYFWRWAMWRTTERPSGPGITAFISPSSYLDGISMAGLRSVMRKWFDEFYIVDLGGDSLGTQVEENVFDIRIPVTIGIGVRHGRSRQLLHPCDVHYVRVSGARDEKLAWLRSHSFAEVDFTNVPGQHIDVMTPVSNAGYWSWPDLEQLLPMSFNGFKAGRTWVIDPSKSTLKERLRHLRRAKGDSRRELFKDSPTGRTIDSTSSRSIMPGTWESTPVREMSDTPPLRRIGYRSFDREWLVADPRFLDRPGQAWASASDQQIFLGTLTSTKLGKGPALVASPYIPDLHFFRNRGARDIFPMWRDASAASANISAGVKHALASELGRFTADDYVSYFYGLAATAAFTDTFGTCLAEQAGPIHIPITKDRGLFDEVAAFGRDLLHWHTFGERFGASELKRTAKELTRISGRPESFSYDVQKRELIVGSGRVGPVSPEVYDFEVSSFKVLQNWLGNRSAGGRGRTSSPLDAIRYTEWEFTEELLLVISILQHTVDVTPDAQALLDKILTGDVFIASDLPQPTKAERSAPR